MIRRDWFRASVGATAAMLVSPLPILARGKQKTVPVVAWRNPGCGCCVGWADHLREAGFEVHLHDTPDLPQVRARLGVPQDLAGCHTAVMEGYLVEGHVPAEFLTRLMAEQPALGGIAVSGMPVGSPGMEGPNPQPFDVIAFGGPEGAERQLFGRVTPGS